MIASALSKNGLTFLALIGVLMLTVTGCSKEPNSPLRIGTNVWIGSEPLYLARGLGFFDPKVVQLVEYPSASEVLRAFRNQAIDGMVISMDELFGLAIDGLQPRVICVADVSDGADVVVGRPGMQSMADLKGKRVAVESVALGAFVLSRALTLSNMKTGDIQIIHLESNEQPSAFNRGEVDGAVTFEPYRSQLTAAGATILFDSTRIPGEIVDVIAVRESVLDEQRAAVRTLLVGWFKAIEYLEKEPKDAARRMSQRQQTSAEQFLRALKGLHIPTREENLAMLDGDSPSLATSGAHLMNLMIDSNLLQQAVNIKDVLEPSPLKTLSP